ncbi:MAG: hypothetical protein AAB552_03170 [Patescibacteria group bacterium]
MMRFNIKKRKSQGGATLPTVLVLTILTLTVAVGITTISFTESFISESGVQSSTALFYAEAGTRDALTKIARNKGYTCASADYCYSIELVSGGCTGSVLGCARVSVSAGAGTTAAPKVVTSKGIVKTSTRTLSVDVILDSGAGTNIGQITSATTTELTN